VPLQHGFNAAGTTQQARAESQVSTTARVVSSQAPRAFGTGMQVEDPDGIRIVQVEVPCPVRGMSV